MKKGKEIKMKGIHFKMDWDELIMDLDDISVGKMVKNAYNHMHKRELSDMDQMESKLFRHIILPVLDYNSERYLEVCEHNAAISRSGVEAKKQKKLQETHANPTGSGDNQNYPSGKLNNPEYPKDRDKEKVKERDIEIDKTKIKSDIDKMEKIVELDLKKINNEKDIDFCIKVKEAVKILDWSRFKLLIFHTDEKDIEIILSDIDKQYCLQGILDIKILYPFLLDNIIK